MAAKTERAIRDQLATGAGILKVARTLGVGVSTVTRIKVSTVYRARRGVTAPLARGEEDQGNSTPAQIGAGG